MLSYSHELSVTRDAYVSNNSSDDGVNFGSSSKLIIGNYSDGTGGETYMHYDIASLGIPKGAIIQAALLYLMQYDDPNDWHSPEITARCTICDASWTEGGIKWTNKPGNLAGGPYTDCTITYDDTSFTSWDLTEHVQGIVNGSYPNNGFRIYKASSGNSNAKYFRSSEYGTAGDRPSLDVYWTYRGAKYWHGSWTEKPVKYWSGTAWVVKPVRRWSGTAWI